jgi:hypothetical protein
MYPVILGRVVTDNILKNRHNTAHQDFADLDNLYQGKVHIPIKNASQPFLAFFPAFSFFLINPL